MKVRIQFQYQAPGATQPEEVTISDVMTELQSGAAVPSVGDIVALMVGNPRNFRTFKVIGRYYHYSYEAERDIIFDCQIIVIVTDPEGNEIGLNPAA